ncbi:Sua5 family C-terminal domain-containing protein, partial [Bartonella sp. AA85SXKL]
AAFHLFQYMRQLDSLKVRSIAVEPIPSYGLGEAINDRLIRAAAPKGK